MKIDLRDGAARDWVETSVKFAAGELASGRLASSSLISRLAENLLAEGIRRYCADSSDEDRGLIKSLNDPQVGRALALMHRDPRAPWSTRTLAREAAVSRSAFVDRFTSLVGVPPIRYLTRRRMHMARLDLREKIGRAHV